MPVADRLRQRCGMTGEARAGGDRQRQAEAEQEEEGRALVRAVAVLNAASAHAVSPH
jgi:hypothetical protein